MSAASHHSRRGVTLVEVLVTIAILGVLLAISLPAVQSSREASRRAECQSRLHQLAVGVTSFHAARNRVPHGHLFEFGETGPRSRAWSWIAEVLPYIGENTLYRGAEIPRTRLQETDIFDKGLSELRCPSDGFSSGEPFDRCGNLRGISFGLTSYQAVEGSNWGQDKSLNIERLNTPWVFKGANGSYDGQDEGDGIMLRSGWRRPIAFRHVHDGLSHTFMLGESLPEQNHWCCAWVYANNTHGTCAIPPNTARAFDAPIAPSDFHNSRSFRSDHPGGVNFALADGAVRYVADGVEFELYRATATIAGRDKPLAAE